MTVSATIDNQSIPDKQPLPWYRYGWPWFLISIPFISVALGSTMLYLAFQANNSLVVDDYYKQGKAINVRIEKDRVASLLGLNADLNITAEGLILQMQQQAPSDLPAGLASKAQTLSAALSWPDTLLLRWIHVTQAQRDGQVQLTSIGGQRYIAQNTTLPTDGKYRLHIYPEDESVVPGLKDTDKSLPDTSTVNEPGESTWRLISQLESFANVSSVRILSPLPNAVYNDAQWQ